MSTHHIKRKIKSINDSPDSSCSKTSQQMDNKSDAVNIKKKEDRKSRAVSESTESMDESIHSKNGKKTTKPKRNPTCTRCFYHKRGEVPVKGHKRDCPFKACECKKCDLNAQRRKLMAKANKEKRKPNNTKSNSKSHLKRQRSDDCSSETDRDSGYSINFEDNDQSKLIDPSKQIIHLQKCLTQIQHELKGIMSPQCMAKSILWLLIESNATSLAEDTTELEDMITDSIIKSSAEYESMSGRPLHHNTNPTMSSMIGPVIPESSTMLRDLQTANNFKSLMHEMHDQNPYLPFLSQFPFLNPILSQHQHQYHLHNKFMYQQIST